MITLSTKASEPASGENPTSILPLAFAELDLKVKPSSIGYLANTGMEKSRAREMISFFMRPLYPQLLLAILWIGGSNECEGDDLKGNIFSD